MSVSATPTRAERLLDRLLPSRRTRAAAAEADGVRHLVGLLCPGPAPRAGAHPYTGKGSTQ